MNPSFRSQSSDHSSEIPIATAKSSNLGVKSTKSKYLQFADKEIEAKEGRNDSNATRTCNSSSVGKGDMGYTERESMESSHRSSSLSASPLEYAEQARNSRRKYIRHRKFHTQNITM